jgi:hypothetical protein
MPELARSYLQRAAIDDLIDELGSATLNGIRAAWCCDDAASAGDDGAREAGWRCRDAALVSAASVDAGEGELLSEGDAAYEALVLADTERKARRFREALDRCAAWVESGTDPAVLPLYRFVADRAWHEDARTYTLADAWDADLRGDPSARRVPPQPTLVGSVLWSLPDGPEGRLELRLAAGGTTFMVVVEDADLEHQISLAEAALVVLHEDEDGVDGLLQVVETTLELLAGQWPPSTGLRAELEVAERRLRDIDDRDPLRRRVAPLAALSGTVVHTFETATDRIELRRTPDGSVWVAVDDDGHVRQVSVFEAASTAAEPDAWRFHDVLEATQTELEFYDRGHDGPTMYDRPPDTDLGDVVLLWEDWQAALDAIGEDSAAQPVAAWALGDLLDEARAEGSDVRVRVRGHQPAPTSRSTASLLRSSSPSTTGQTTPSWWWTPASAPTSR